LQHAAGVGHAFEQAGDRPAVPILRQVGDLIGNVDVAGVSGGQDMAHRYAAFGRLRQRETQRTGLAYDSDRMRLQRPPVRHGRKGETRADRVVHKADRVRPDHSHVPVPHNREQPLLQSDVLRLAGLGVPGREHQDGADAARRAFPRDRLDRLARRRDHHAVRRFWKRGDVGVAGTAG
jgi:hypothetical protein